MKPGCCEVEVLLSLRAAGAVAELPAADSARLDRHLEACPECRRQLEQDRELLDLVRLPPPGAAETLAMADLPSRALGELRRRDRRRGLLQRAVAAGGGMAVAAALVVALLSPAISRHRAPATAAGSPPAVQQVAWKEPDVDSLWDESDVIDTGSTTSSQGTMTEAVLAAYDAGDGI